MKKENRRVLWEGVHSGTSSGDLQSLLVMADGVIFEEFYDRDGLAYTHFSLNSYLRSMKGGWYKGPPLSEEAKKLIKIQLTIQELQR